MHHEYVFENEYTRATGTGVYVATSASREAGADGTVTIVEVDSTPAHTSPDEVRLASSIAVHNALRKASDW